MRRKPEHTTRRIGGEPPKRRPLAGALGAVFRLGFEIFGLLVILVLMVIDIALVQPLRLVFRRPR